MKAIREIISLHAGSIYCGITDACGEADRYILFLMKRKQRQYQLKFRPVGFAVMLITFNEMTTLMRENYMRHGDVAAPFEIIGTGNSIIYKSSAHRE